MNMKKILAAVICAATTLSLAGCGNSLDDDMFKDITGQTSGQGANTSPGTFKKPNIGGIRNKDSVPYADEADFETENITYEPTFSVNIDCVIITKYTGNSKVIKIPDEIDDKPVLFLGNSTTGDTGVFAGLSDITVITPAYFMWIENCFFDCSNVTLDVSAPEPFVEYATEYETNVYFEENSFKGCKGVTVNMPENNVQQIRANAFSGCSDVDSMVIPDDIKKVEKAAFDSGSIPKSITYRGETYDASQYNEFIEAVEYYGVRPYDDGILGHSTLKITDPYGPGLGLNFYHLEGVPRDTEGTYIVPEDVRVICDFAFIGCTSLENIVLHSNLEINEKAFEGYDGNITYKGKTYKASEFNFAEAIKEASEQVTDWDSVPYALESDFEYEVLGMYFSKTISIKKYNGTSKQVKIPETINGIKVGSLYGKAPYDAVFDSMPDIEVLLPEDVALRDVFSLCGGAKLYLPDTKIDLNGAMKVLESGTSVVYKGVVYDNAHAQEFNDAVNGNSGS